MINYNYNRQVDPPAPFAHLSLRRPHESGGHIEVPAKLDTAADVTVLPEHVVRALGLVPFQQTYVQGFLSSRPEEVPTFLVWAAFRSRREILLEAVLGAEEEYFLLGRDVLNAYRIILDGPNLKLEIHDPTA